MLERERENAACNGTRLRVLEPTIHGPVMETDAAHEEKLSGAGKRTATSTDRSEGDDDGTEQQESRRKRVKVELGASGGEALKQEGPPQQRHDKKKKKKKEKKSKSKGSKKAIKLRWGTFRGLRVGERERV